MRVLELPVSTGTHDAGNSLLCQEWKLYERLAKRYKEGHFSGLTKLNWNKNSQMRGVTEWLKSSDQVCGLSTVGNEAWKVETPQFNISSEQKSENLRYYNFRNFGCILLLYQILYISFVYWGLKYFWQLQLSCVEWEEYKYCSWIIAPEKVAEVELLSQAWKQTCFMVSSSVNSKKNV